MSSEFALLRFPTLEGAEQADVRERAGYAPWMDEVAFVEHRRSGRLVVRETLAGHYLDAEEDGDVIGTPAPERSRVPSPARSSGLPVLRSGP